MGSYHSIAKHNDAILQQLEKDYIVDDHFMAKDNSLIKSLFDRKTAKTYILRIIPTHSSKESSELVSQLSLNIKSPSECITPLYTYYKHTVNCVSANKEVFYLLFALNHSITLQSQINKRAHQSKFFKEEELLQGIQNLGKALAWLKYMTQNPKERVCAHGNINAQTVYYASDLNCGRFILGNPMISPVPPQDFIEKYPSPERLMQLRKVQVKDFDPFDSDLFSAAMTILQASNLGKMQRVYTKCLINYQTLKLNLRRCPYQKVRELLSDILLGDISTRKKYLEQWQPKGELFSSRKIKLASIQKNRSKFRGKSQQKIQLVNSKSNSHLSLSTKIPMITSQTCLTQHNSCSNIPSKKTVKVQKQTQKIEANKQSKATVVNFNYTNKQNLKYLDQSSMEYRSYLHISSKPSDGFAPNQISQYISRIKLRLDQLQKDLQSTLQLKSESPLQASNPNPKAKIQNLSKSMYLARTQKSEDISACEYTINIKSVDDSKIQLLQPQQCDDSLHSSVFQQSLLEREADKQTNKSKASDQEFIYQASYTINQSKISAGSVSNSRDSFQIREQGIQDSTSYAINMKGTQLEVLSNLIIPEEESSQEESVEDSAEGRPRGELVDESYQNGGSYKGYAVDGKRHGTGTFVYAEGGTYIGQWKNNRMNGFGKLYYSQSKIAYEGFWYEDSFHGRGKLFNDQILSVGPQFKYQNYADIEKYWVSYEGDFASDCKEGYGKLIFSNDWQYHGQFHKDLPHGKGFFKARNKEIHGIWNEGILVKQI